MVDPNSSPNSIVYKVRNAAGEVVAEHHHVNKNGGKQCYWRRPDGEWGLNGTPLASLPPYGVHELKGEPTLTVVAEGEKARDALAKALKAHNVCVLGTVTGASGAPSPEVLEVLRGHEVVLWPDADKPGREHMDRIAERLQEIAAMVRLYECPEAENEGDDAADHPAVISGDPKAVDRLLADLCEAREWGAPKYEPEPSPNGSPATPEFRLTDIGNAERLVDRHGENVRYVHARGRWLDWDGKRWRIDDTGEIDRRAKDTVRSIYGEAEAATDSSTRKELASHAMKCESESRLRAMVALAQSEEGIPVRVDALDADPWLLNVANGTIDLRTEELREHHRENLITKLAPVEYDPGAQAPAWEAFLERMLPDKEVRRFLQRAVGYSLTGDTRERVLLILHGMGRNGKSTFLEAIREALGSEDGYAMKMPAETLMAKPTGGIPNDIARLKGARFVSASETEKDRRLAEALVKEITGNDTISARFMRGEWFDFRPTHKVWLGTNHKPEIRGTDPAIWDRIRLVPFDVRIPDEEIDKKLPEKLRAELPGILTWAVRGCLDWQRDGLGEPESVEAATAEYRSEMDTLATFIHEQCVVRPGVWCVFANLYENYEAWCRASGENPESRRKFGARLKERGFPPDNGTGNVAIRRDISLRDDRKPDGPEPPDDKDSGTSRVNEETPSEASAGASEGTSGQGVNEPASKVNSQIPCKAQESGEVVNESYPTSGLTSRNSLVREELESRLTKVNSLIPGQNPPASASRRLTADEVAQVQHLMADGWSAAAARAEVLGEEMM